MTNNTQMVSVPRELLESAARELEWHKTPGAANRAHDLRLALAAPAEDVRAVADEPVTYSDLRRYLNAPPCCHAQRKIVMPELLPVPEILAGLSRKYAEGWNACLTEFERINK